MDAFIAGFMKCGTTGLFELLAQHPEICAAKEKEPAFFSNDDVFAKGAPWYQRLFQGPGDVRLEASTAYGMTHKFPRTLERLQAWPAPKRFIFMVRDPVARIESHYRHDQSNYWGEMLRDGADALHPHAVATSDYARHIDAYVAAFGQDNVMAVTLDDLHATPQATLRGICRFLGIDDGFRFDLDVRRNEAAERRQVRPWIRRVGRIVGLGRYQRVGVWMRRVGLGGLFLRSSPPDFVLPEAWADQARKELAPSMARLARDHGVDVGLWGFRTQIDP